MTMVMMTCYLPWSFVLIGCFVAVRTTNTPRKEYVNLTAPDITALHVRHGQQLVSPDWTDAEWQMHQGQGQDNRRRRARSIVDFGDWASKKWKLPIKYAINASAFLTGHRQFIMDALAHYSKLTCVTFQEVNPYATMRDHYLYFTNVNDHTCSSWVGRKKFWHPTNLRQDIKLAPRCFEYGMSLAVHELGHALGLQHEHNRRDRDYFIEVHMEHVKKGKERAFNYNQNLDWRSLDQPYDYGSIMHYHGRALSKGTGFTIETRDPRYQYTIGQVNGLSFFDAKLINNEYCYDECPRDLDCKYGGYVDPKDCTRCRCPDGFAGRWCDAPELRGSAKCNPHSGPIDVMSGDMKFLYSPNYHYGIYSPGDHCSWWLKAPPGCKLELFFVGPFSVYCSATCLHWVEVRYQDQLRGVGPRFCCQNGWPDDDRSTPMVSEGNDAIVTFRTDFDRMYDYYRQIVYQRKIDLNATMKGFRLAYKMHDTKCLEKRYGGSRKGLQAQVPIIKKTKPTAPVHNEVIAKPIPPSPEPVHKARVSLVSKQWLWARKYLRSSKYVIPKESIARKHRTTALNKRTSASNNYASSPPTSSKQGLKVSNTANAKVGLSTSSKVHNEIHKSSGSPKYTKSDGLTRIAVPNTKVYMTKKQVIATKRRHRKQEIKRNRKERRRQRRIRRKTKKKRLNKNPGHSTL